MGFNYITLFCLPFGVLLPILAIIFLAVMKKKKAVSFDSVFMGFGAFFASIAAVAVAFIIVNTIFLAGLRFSDENSGMTSVGIIIAVLITALYIVCESFKMSIIKKFQIADNPKSFSSVGFSAGVVLAQNIVVFIALNIFSHYEMSAGYALFSGAILFFTGIMYTVISYACEIMLKDNFKGPSYALSSVYYLFWLSIVFIIALGADMARSSILVYIMSGFFFVLSFVLSGVFMFKFKKTKKEGNTK